MSVVKGVHSLPVEYLDQLMSPAIYNNDKAHVRYFKQLLQYSNSQIYSSTLHC